MTGNEPQAAPVSIRPCMVTIVHIGDSITFGQYLQEEHRWTDLVSQRLNRKYENTPVCLASLNKGVSGETTRMALERFGKDVQAVAPDILTLQFGLNDCNCWLTDRGLPRVSEDAFRANLSEMVRRAKHFGASHVILANNHPTTRLKPMPSGEAYEEANARYSRISQEVAEESDGIFCDVRKRFERFGLKELSKLLLPFPDQLHLSVEGNQIYADLIGPVIEQAVEDIVNKS